MHLQGDVSCRVRVVSYGGDGNGRCGIIGLAGHFAGRMVRAVSLTRARGRGRREQDKGKKENKIAPTRAVRAVSLTRARARGRGAQRKGGKERKEPLQGQCAPCP